jgi:hypothetical protein
MAAPQLTIQDQRAFELAAIVTPDLPRRTFL